MAKSKWNNQPAAQELLTRIESLKLHSGQESPQVFSHKDFNSSFSSKNMKHYSMLLKDIAKFNSEVPDSVKQELVDNAIWTSADANKLQDGYVGNVLKKNEENYLNRPLKEFVLITGLNISGLNNNRRIKTPDSTIIISNNIPNKFKKTITTVK